MRILIKVALFFSTVAVVKFISDTLVRQEEENYYKMKEIESFMGYLKICACSLKIQSNEIIDKYNFKYSDVEDYIKELFLKDVLLSEAMGMGMKNSKKLQLPKDFIDITSTIKDFYGIAFSQELSERIEIVIKDMKEYIKKI